MNQKYVVTLFFLQISCLCFAQGNLESGKSFFSQIVAFFSGAEQEAISVEQKIVGAANTATQVVGNDIAAIRATAATVEESAQVVQQTVTNVESKAEALVDDLKAAENSGL